MTVTRILTFAESPELLGGEDAGGQYDVVANDAVVWVVSVVRGALSAGASRLTLVVL